MSQKPDLLLWLSDRRDNCKRIGNTKTGLDRDGWLNDMAYFQNAIDVISGTQPDPQCSDNPKNALGFEIPQTIKDLTTRAGISEVIGAFNRVKMFADVSTNNVAPFMVHAKKQLDDDLEIISKHLAEMKGKNHDR